MKKTIPLLALLLSGLTSDLIMAEPKTLSVNLDQSKIEWVGKKVTGEHSGDLKLKSGSIIMDGEQLLGGEFVFDMNSINNTDLTDPDKKGKIEGHLKSEDFFDVAKFPEGKFKILKATPTENGYKLLGELTLKAIALPIEFTAAITKSDSGYTGLAATSFDRTRWDIRYNSDKFFNPAQLGDKLIYNDINVKLNIVAK